MSTIGDLTLNDIGKTRLRIDHGGSTVEGILTDLDIDVETTEIRGMQGTRIIERGTLIVTVTPTLGSITLDGLNRNHPCEVTR